MSAFSDWQEPLAERDYRGRRPRPSPRHGADADLPLMKWSLGTMFALVMAHERRHIWQARQVRNDRRFPP